MADKYLSINANGVKQEIEATVTSAGAGNAGDIPALDGSGKLDVSLLPTSASFSLPSFENITAGQQIHIFDDSGTVKIRRANAASGLKSHGFALQTVTAPAACGVQLDDGVNSYLSGLTVGVEYFLSGTTPGEVTATPVTASGQLLQRVGVAKSATELAQDIDEPIVRA